LFEARRVQSRPQAERSGLENEGPAAGGRSSLAQARADGGIQRLLESIPGTVHGIAQQPLDIFVQSHGGSHVRIMMPKGRAVKMHTIQMTVLREFLTGERPREPKPGPGTQEIRARAIMRHTAAAVRPRQ